MVGASPEVLDVRVMRERLFEERPETVLPSFLVIGAAKSGTTSLCEYLRLHPQVFVSEPKEPQFFPIEFNWHRGLEWYAAHFDGARGSLAVGEGSTTYTRYPYSKGVPARIAGLLPDVRLVYLVRHPIERMISQYQQHIWHGWEQDRSIESALRRNPFYTDISRYATQIEQYLEVFAPDRLLVITSEDLRSERAETIRQVLAFVGVDTEMPIEGLDREFNSTDEKRKPRPMDGVLRKLPGYERIAGRTPIPIRRLKYYLTTRGAGPRPTISDALRSELEDRLRDEIRRLHRHMDGRFDGWGIA